MSVIKVINLTKAFGSGRTYVKAVDDVSLTVEAGDIILVMGPSGSGKTTLISMIGTLMKPTSGQVLIDGKEVSNLDNSDIADLRLKYFGFMFQSFNLLSALNALQNVALPLRTAGASKKQANSKAAELLEKFHLGKRLENLPRNLSGGEKQRVAIARALANNPKLILADEPTANLDSKAGLEVMQLLCSIACAEKRSVIIVSHDARLKDVARRVITIADGKLTREEKGGHDISCPHHKSMGLEK